MLVELSQLSRDDNAAPFRFQEQDTLGNSKATGFVSLRCQVKVRGRDQDPPAVYLKKGKLVKLDASGGASVAELGQSAGRIRGGAKLSPAPSMHSSASLRWVLHAIVFGPQHRPGRLGRLILWLRN